MFSHSSASPENVLAIKSAIDCPGVRFPSSRTPFAHRNRPQQHPNAVARQDLLMASQWPYERITRPGDNLPYRSLLGVQASQQVFGARARDSKLFVHVEC